MTTFHAPHRLFLIALILPILLGGCVTEDRYSAYTAEEKAILEADQIARQQQEESQLATLKGQETVNDAILSAALTQGGHPVTGIQSRGTDIFDGQWAVQESPYTHTKFYEYARGTYIAGGGMVSGVYRGDFKFFPDPGEDLRTGTYVMIGTRTSNTGATTKGIFVAQNSIENHPVYFYQATPDFLNTVENKYRRQIADWRAEQERQRAAAASGSSFNFGQILALGLGGMMIATSDIPGADKLEIGTALFQDIMTDGEANALTTLTSDYQGRYLDSTIAGPAPATATTSTSVQTAQTPSAPAGKSASYSFTCPTGQSNTIDIPYKSASCLAAKKQMTEIYSCNLVDDFGKVAGICQNGCGTPQCTE